MVVGHLISHITGKDTSFKYVNHEQEAKHKGKLEVEKRQQDSIAPEPIIPPVDVVRFKHKADYIKQRLNPQNDPDKDLDLTNMRGLIFDVDQFVLRNQITLDLHQRHRLHDEYFGVLTDHNFFVSFRSVNPSTPDRYKYWRLQLAPTFYAGKFPDFRKFNGKANQKDRDEYLKSQQANWMSKKPRSDLMLELDRESAEDHALSEIAYRDEIVIGEGIFDVMTEWLHDSCGLADRVRGYYCAFSKSNIEKMLGAGSIAIYEKLLLPVVHILADSDTPPDFYKNIMAKRYYNIEKMLIYYNNGHDDWNCFPLRPECRAVFRNSKYLKNKQRRKIAL